MLHCERNLASGISARRVHSTAGHNCRFHGARGIYYYCGTRRDFTVHWDHGVGLDDGSADHVGSARAHSMVRSI